MISQPMVGKTNLEIAKVRKKATQYLENKGFEVVNTFFIKITEIKKFFSTSPIYLKFAYP